MNNKILSIALLLFTFNIGFSQTEKSEQRLHELGVVVNGDFSFGADYKVGTANKLWRFSALGASGQWDHNYFVGQSTPKGYTNNIHFSVGHEWRKSLFENFFFASGVQLGMAYDLEISDDNSFANGLQYYTTTHRFRPSLGVVLGIRYILKDKINFSLTWIPNVYYAHVTTKRVLSDQQTVINETWNTGNAFGYRMSWSSLRLVIAYRFYTDKKKKEKIAPPAKS